MTSEQRRQIEMLYRAALALPTEERAAFLATRAGNDEELRRGAEALLADKGGTEIREEPETGTDIEVGTQLGSYRIDGRLGKGGMGVVYRATDTKLNRPAAIKFLAEDLFDANARRRFQREAQMASALNHPHILTVYDAGEYADRQYLVTELVDGGTLQDWADAEPHRWRQIVELMVGVADALAAAHAVSILHRDVKPANILISKNGYAKLADFGLAKLVEDTESGRARGGDQTATAAVVGTAAYMSPEQALGRLLDARSDIFSFGVVLYELLAGRHPFAGETDIVMLQSVIHVSPAPLSDEIPEGLRTVVEKALEKDPAERYQSMRELVVDLRRIARKTSADRLPAARPAPAPSRAGIAWWTAGLALVAMLGAVAIALTRHTPVAPAELSRFEISPPEKATLGAPRGASVALSPDGRQLAFAATDAAGVSRLWVRALSSATPRPLNGSEDGVWPFWSPDGKSLGFFARGKLRRVDLAGGPPSILADAVFPFGGTWNRDGVIVFSPSRGSPLLRVPAAGGTPKPVTELPGSVAHVGPFFLPDGRHFLFAAFREPSQRDIMIASLDSTDVTPILTGVVDFSVAYAAPGYLLFLRGGALMAQAFDDAGLATRGEPRPVAENVRGENSFATSQNGTLVYQSGAAAQNELVWVGRDGRQSSTAAPRGEYANVALSRDETRLAFNLLGPTGNDVWLMDLQRGVPSRFTFQPQSVAPLWSPDGKYVAFATSRNGPFDIYRRPSNSNGPDESFLELGVSSTMSPSDWSADGRFLTYYRTDPKTERDVWVLPLGSDGNRTSEKPFALLHEPYNESEAQFSPDGKWIAYVSDESGTAQIYVQSFPVLTAKWQISTDGATQPRWSRDGKEFFYLTLNQKLTVAAVTTGDNFEVRATRTLFDTTLRTNDGRQTYAVSADGQRFLFNVPVEAAASPLTVVLNWPALLE